MYTVYALQPASHVLSKKGDLRRRAPRWIIAMSNRLARGADRFEAARVRWDFLLVTMTGSPRTPGVGGRAGHRGSVDKGFRRRLAGIGGGDCQGERAHASSAASNTDFGGQPIELAYPLNARRLFPRFSASCWISRIRSPMMAYVDA